VPMVSRQKITKGMLMKCRLCLVVMMVVGCWVSDLWAIGETAVTTLSLPYGARQLGMGEVGVTLADDESATFWNPARLGIRNERWEAGAATVYSDEVFSPGPWHFAGAGCYQLSFPKITFGSGAMVNYLNLGVHDSYNESGELIDIKRPYEIIGGLSIGIGFLNGRPTQHGLGMSAKLIKSAFAPSFIPNGEVVGRTFAIDIGYLCVLPFGIRLGATFLNMGPSIWYVTPEESYPLPFTGRIGVGYKHEFCTSYLSVAQLSMEYSINHEFSHRDGFPGEPDPFYKALFSEDHFPEELIHNTGCEIKIFRTGAARIGFLNDPAGRRRDLHWGFGVSLFNHFDVDWHIVGSLNNSLARARSWGYSFSFWNMFNFKPADLQWWRKAG
jgi:hypothetical protein